MSRFHRDVDLERFDSTSDVTAGEQRRQDRSVPNSFLAEMKRSRNEEDEEAAMASLRKRMAGRECAFAALLMMSA